MTSDQEDSGVIGITFFSHLRGFHREDGTVLPNTELEVMSNGPTICCNLGNDLTGDVRSSMTLAEHRKKCLIDALSSSCVPKLLFQYLRPEVLTCGLSHYDTIDIVRKWVLLFMK